MSKTKRQGPSWLSEQVRAESQQRYPKLASPKLVHRVREKLAGFVPKSVFIALLIFVVGLGLNEFCVSRGWILATYNLSPESSADILANSLEYIAALVGIVLPVVLLIVEFVGREASSVIDVYLDEIGIKGTAILALSVLGLEALAMWITRSSIVSHPKTLFYIIYLLMLLNLSVLFETGLAIWRVRRSVSSAFLVHALLTRLTNEIRASQRGEAEYRLSRLAHADWCVSLNLRRILSLSQPQGTVAICSPVSGVIQDVHKPHFTQFGEALQSRVAGEPPAKAYIMKLIGDFVSEGEILAYVSVEEGDRIEELERALARSLKIKEPSAKGSDISRLLTQVKQMAETAVREQNGALFNELLGVYSHIFSLGIGLPVPPSVEWVPDLFRGWNVSATAVFHLRDLVEAAAMNKSHRFVSALAYEIAGVAKAMIAHSAESVDESLRDVLGLFVTLYFFSRECENELGVERSFHFLAGDMVSRTWTLCLRNTREDLQAVKNLLGVLRLILFTLSDLLHSMIGQRDVNNIKTLLHRMQPAELLASFHLVGPLAQQRFSLLQELRDLPEDQREERRTQLEALSLCESIPQNVSRFFAELVFVAASYVVEGYDRDDIDAAQLEPLLRVIKPHLGPFAQSLTLFSDLVRGPSSFAWSRFHRHPDTRRFFWADDEGKYYLFYCLHGIETLAPDQVQGKFPAVDLRHQLPRIEKTCERVVASADKWTGILEFSPSELSERVEEFVTLNKQISERWQLERENRIIKADLDPDKVAAFVEAVEDILKTHPSSLRRLLELHGKVTECARLPSATTGGRFEKIRLKEKEFFTALYEDVEFVRQLGLQYGLGLVRAEDYQIVAKWMAKGRSLRTKKDWRTLEPYLEKALARFEETDHRASLILTSSNLQYEVFSCTPNFANRYEVDVENIPEFRDFNIRGFYKEIPIVQWGFEQDTPHILVIDLERASKLEVERPTIEVGLLSESERRKILERSPNRTERELQLSVSVKVTEKAKATVLDRNAVLKLKLKLPRDAFMQFEQHHSDTNGVHR